jgi:GTP cyclohydrolase I
MAPVSELHVDGRLGSPQRDAIDHDGAEMAIHDLLVALGRDVSDPGLQDTPRRVAAAFAEMLTREPVALTTFPNEELAARAGVLAQHAEQRRGRRSRARLLHAAQ